MQRLYTILCYCLYYVRSDYVWRLACTAKAPEERSTHMAACAQRHRLRCLTYLPSTNRSSSVVLPTPCICRSVMCVKRLVSPGGARWLLSTQEEQLCMGEARADIKNGMLTSMKDMLAHRIAYDNHLERRWPPALNSAGRSSRTATPLLCDSPERLRSLGQLPSSWCSLRARRLWRSVGIACRRSQSVLSFSRGRFGC